MKEFKVKEQNKNETVYVLEDASSGGTSSGAVATVSKPLGGVQRRNKDNLLVGEEGSGDPTIEQMSDEELAHFLGVPVKLVTDNREHAEEVARDKASDSADTQEGATLTTTGPGSEVSLYDPGGLSDNFKQQMANDTEIKFLRDKAKLARDIANNNPEGWRDIGEAKKGLWANIHAKRKRIKGGSGEHMRKPGSKGAPTAQAFKDAAKEGKETPKLNAPRNPVAKNSRSSGAGAHKDKSKVIPRKEKYKNKDLAESTNAPDINELQKIVNGLEQAIKQARGITSAIKNDDVVLGIISEIQDLAKKWKIDQSELEYSIRDVQSANKSLISAVYGLEDAFQEAYRSADNKLEELISAKEEEEYNKRWGRGSENNSLEESYNTQLSESTDHEGTMARSELYRNAKYGIKMLKMVRPGEEIEGWVESCLTKAASALDKVYHYLDYKTHNGEPVDQSNDLDDEIFEDGDEADTALENLMSIVEYSTKLYKMINDGDDLEGWVFMKLTKASECVSSAKHHMDYLQFKKHGLADDFEESIKKKKTKRVSESTDEVTEGPFTKSGNWMMKRKLEKDIKQHDKDLDNDSKKFWLSGSGLPPWHPDEYREPVDPTFNWGQVADLKARKEKLLARLNKYQK